MTSIRVTAQGRSYTFGPGATISIGGAQECDVIVRSEAVTGRHAHLVPGGSGWRLTGDQVPDGIWADGRPVTSLPVTDSVTAWLGRPRGAAEVRLELVGTADGGGQTPALVTRLGRDQRIFPVGTHVRVGRDPSLELLSLNPLVSRHCHGVIISDPEGAIFIDQSRRVSFLDGKRLPKPLRITESVVLRLGDPATGEELGITPPLSSSQLDRYHGRRVLSGRPAQRHPASATPVSPPAWTPRC